MQKIHKIQSIIFDVNLARREEVEVFADTLNSIDVQQVFERVFRQFDYISERILIENLALDLGNVGYDDFEEKLKEALASKLNELTGFRSKNYQISEALNPEEVELDALMYFLQFGSLNWTFENSQIFDIERVIDKLIQNKREVFKQKLSAILPFRVVQKRLIQTVSEAILNKIYLLFFRQEEVYFSIEIIDFFRANFDFKITDSKQFIHEILLQNIVLKVQGFDGLEKLIEQLIQHIKSSKKIDVEKTKFISLNLEKIQKKYQNDSQILKKIQLIDSKIKDKIDFEFDDKIESKINQNAEFRNHKNPTKNEIDADEYIHKNLELDPESLPDSYFVENAGLVIVWYHLRLLFEHLGLIKNKEFIDKNAQMRALQVLDFMVFGNRKMKEYGLVLNKILVGLEPEENIEITQQITDNEVFMIEEFLQEAIIKQWTILKNTSIEGLRNTFLKRNGKLTRTENGWFLQVEPKGGIDMLLNSLPWGLSFIKMNWMPKPLTIEWKRN
jgi:hypothetical protein